jgi:hypothetical protein
MIMSNGGKTVAKEWGENSSKGMGGKPHTALTRRKNPKHLGTVGPNATKATK